MLVLLAGPAWPYPRRDLRAVPEYWRAARRLLAGGVEDGYLVGPPRCDHVDMPTTMPMALMRQRVVLQVSRVEMMQIESKAKEAGMSVANYFRSLAGLPPLSAGRPTRGQMEEEQDRAWEILQSMGIDPAPFFPTDESWLDEYR